LRKDQANEEEIILLGRAEAEHGNSQLLVEEPLRLRLRLFFWCLAIVLGALHVWVYRNDLNPDSVSYIEMAEAALRSSWHVLVNAYWSPLYPALLSIGFRILHPPMHWEFTVVHLVNFVVYLADLLCFEFFLKELLAARRIETGLENSLRPIPEKIFWIWGYLLFIWSNLFWLRPQQVNPDIIVAGLVYSATALLLRTYRGKGDWLAFAGLGAVLGTAYLTKAVMFPLSFIFLACGFFLFGMTRQSYSGALARSALALAVFAIIAAPLIVALSKEKHRVTFGDTGRLNYAQLIDGAPYLTHWQGQPAGTGTPVHPTRRVSFDPPIYEFAQPVAGSYPPWYDPSYWYEGIRAHFSLRGQLWVLFKSANGYFKLFSRSGALYVVFLALILLVRKTGKWDWGERRLRLVWLPSLVALFMYSLILIKQRYVSGFALVVLFWILSSARIAFVEGEVFGKRALWATILAPAVALLWPLAVNVRETIANRPYDQELVADGLRDMGIVPGTQVASIGSGLEAYWAHLAQVKIIAEIPEKGTSFLAVDPPRRREVLDKFLELGAKAVVTKNAPVAHSIEGWQEMGQTQYYVWRPPANSQ
jgi:4-amino-4-deoxy-L-arabinose transferase-like glycosyltransferase